MLVANSFDLWQRDTFFSAAEEVQQSADIMESAYRRWEREKREVVTSEDLDELCKELQTALGTAKWQLEEFERAIRQSYRNRADDATMARHRQFVDAIENQISGVETALQESFREEGRQPIRWVNLNEDECNDLAIFLSGTPSTSQTMKNESAKFGASTSSSFQGNNGMKKEAKGSHKDFLASNKETKHIIIGIEATETPGSRDDINCQNDRTSGTRRMWSSPNIASWKTVIANKDEKKNTLLPSIEATLKEKGSKPVFWRERGDDHLEAKGGILSYSQLRGTRWINQILGQVGGCQGQLQAPIHSRLSSVRFKLVLMLTLFLIGKFLIHLNLQGPK
ncbi:hypothetical protein U1Q18_026525 [Sarracenia purpurea var. burkii]